MSLQEELRGPPPAKLVVDHVSKWFQQKRQTIHALDDVAFDVAEGEFIVIVGPSGCGKSTLLDIIAGLEKPDKGQVLADNQPVLHPGRHRLVMFQESALFPWLNTFGNVMFGLRLKPGLRNSERREVAKFFLHLVGLEKFMEANVHELSGGMKQRVALARALAPNPRVFLSPHRSGAHAPRHALAASLCLIVWSLGYRNTPNKKSNPIDIAAEITSEPRHPSRFEKKKNIRRALQGGLARSRLPGRSGHDHVADTGKIARCF